MARQTALPPTLPPRLIGREAAAAYVSVAPSTFNELVENGLMPLPKQVWGRRIAWDVRELDAAVDALPLAPTGDETWSDVDAPQAPAVR